MINQLTLVWVNLPPPTKFSLITQKWYKMQPWHFAAFSNILSETFVPKFGISNSPQSPDIGQNSDEGISDLAISGESLINENRRIRKLEQVTKIDERNIATLKKLHDDGTPVNCHFLEFMANLELSRRRILDFMSLVLVFSL